MKSICHKMAVTVVFSLFLVASSYAGTTVEFPQMSFKCQYNDCVIGGGKRSCQVTDSKGGVVMINGVSRGQCTMFKNKKVIWSNGDKSYTAKTVSSKEVRR